MNLFNSNNNKFNDCKKIICLGNKTKLGFLLIKTLREIVCKKKINLCINEYYDSKEFFSKNNLSIKENISNEKVIVVFCATGGVRTENHSTDKAKSSLKYDLSLLRHLIKYSDEIQVIYISSVLGLINSKKNIDYSFSKRMAEIELKKVLVDYENIRGLSIIYPGRLINNWLKFFISGSITYKRLVEIIIKVISKKVNLNYCLTGLDAFIFLLIKRPRLLKDLSLRII